MGVVHGFDDGGQRAGAPLVHVVVQLRVPDKVPLHGVHGAVACVDGGELLDDLVKGEPERTALRVGVPRLVEPLAQPRLDVELGRLGQPGGDGHGGLDAALERAGEDVRDAAGGERAAQRARLGDAGGRQGGVVRTRGGDVPRAVDKVEALAMARQEDAGGGALVLVVRHCDAPPSAPAPTLPNQIAPCNAQCASRMCATEKIKL